MNSISTTIHTNDTEIYQQEQQEHKNKSYISSIPTTKIIRNNKSEQQKQDILDHNNNNHYTNNDVDSINVIVSEKKELQRLLYKLDFRIILLISLCYTFSFMDRTNIGTFTFLLSFKKGKKKGKKKIMV